MAYVKTTWKDQNVEKPRTYSVRDNGDDTITLLDAFGTVTEMGTPVNAQNMNHIEDGIASLDTGKANDSDVVKLTGAQSISGSKTFNSPIITKYGQGIQIYGVNTFYTIRSAGNPQDDFSIMIGNDASNAFFVVDANANTVKIGSSTIPAKANVPTTTTSTTDEYIATTGWANTRFRITGAASTIQTNNLTANRVLISNNNQKVAVSSTTSTELGYLNGVTSAIQTQLNAKQATITGSASTIATSNLTASRALVTNADKKVAVSSTTSTELGYVHGVTSAIQTQINAKAADNAVVKLTGNQSVAGAKTFSNVCYGTASDAANSLLTTVAKSKSASGYFKLGNGLIVQWGSFSEKGTVRLPVAFTSTNYKIACAETGSHEYGPQIDDESLTTISFAVKNGRPAFYIAIGY